MLINLSSLGYNYAEMKRDEIQKLFKVLGEELEKAKDRERKVKEAADEIARSAYNSPSQSGDRFHSQSQADIAKENVERLENILKKVEKELQNPVPESITPVCWINLEYEDGGKDGFFLLDEPLSISGYKFVSSNSPFGNKLKGKKVGEKFEFVSGDIRKAGTVVLIE